MAPLEELDDSTKGLERWHGAGLLWNFLIPITNTKGSYLYPCSNTTTIRPRLQHLLPKINVPAPMSVSHPSSVHPFFIFKPHRIPECFLFQAWNNPSAEWWRAPDRRHFYWMLWGKPLTEWYSPAKLGPQVSLFPVPIFDVNTCLFNYGIKDDLIPELTINAQRPQAEPVQHPFFRPSNCWSFRSDPNPSSSTYQASIFKWRTKTKLSR
jgi:hypothetical protein